MGHPVLILVKISEDNLPSMPPHGSIFTAQETMLDYAFHHLGLNGDDGVDRPVVMTEALANPNSSRASEAIIPFSP